MSPGFPQHLSYKSPIPTPSLSWLDFPAPVAILWTGFVIVLLSEALARTVILQLIINQPLTSLILSAMLLVIQLQIPLIQWFLTLAAH